MKYLVNINNGGQKVLRVIFDFNSDGFLIGFKLDSMITNDGLVWIHEHMPFIQEALTEWEKIIKNCHIEAIQDDTTFPGFWNAYNYKVGNKKRAEKLWTLLNEQEKLLALSSIRKYDRYLAQRPKMEKAYPETWLAQRRWENEFK